MAPLQQQYALVKCQRMRPNRRQLQRSRTLWQLPSVAPQPPSVALRQHSVAIGCPPTRGGATTTGPPLPAICQNLGGGSAGGLGGGFPRWGGLHATHYYHMHTSRGDVCLGGSVSMGLGGVAYKDRARPPPRAPNRRPLASTCQLFLRTPNLSVFGLSRLPGWAYTRNACMWARRMHQPNCPQRNC